MGKEQFNEILEILRDESKSKFSSHDFIKKFAETYEHEYIAMLWEKRNAEHPFQTVHSQIGLELERMQNYCEIKFKKEKRDYSENIFGKKDEVQFGIII